MLQMMGAFAEFERSLIRERQAEGIARAKAKGVYTGRKRQLTDDQVDEIRKRRDAGERVAALARGVRCQPHNRLCAASGAGKSRN